MVSPVARLVHPLTCLLRCLWAEAVAVHRHNYKLLQLDMSSNLAAIAARVPTTPEVLVLGACDEERQQDVETSR